MTDTLANRPLKLFLFMLTLRDYLFEETVESLKSRLSLVKNIAASQRKADLIEALISALSGESLQEIWDSYTSLERQAIAETCYATDCEFSKEKILAKYGECPSFSLPRADPSSSSRSSRVNPSRFSIFFFTKRYTRKLSLPDDLAAKLRDFVPKPPPLTIKATPEPRDEPGLTIRETEQDALRDVVTLLRLAEQKKLKATAKTGMPTAAAKKTVIDSLSGGDFFPPEVAYPPKRRKWDQEMGSIKPVGWVRLLQAGGYLKTDLTPAGLKALSKPTPDLIRHLWKKWLTNTSFDEFNRVDEIKGQKAKGHMTAKPPRRKVIVEALQECPPNEWIDIQAFSAFMVAESLTFEVSNQVHRLYLCDPEYGNFGYDGYGGWETVEFRYLLAFLFEHAATLGLIDVAFVHPEKALDDYRDQWGADDFDWLSRYDGLRAFRITNLGAWCLGLTDDFIQTTPESNIHLELSDDLTIQLKANSILPADSLLLETWSKPTSETSWTLDPSRARDAIERGNSPGDFLSFLQESDPRGIPAAIITFFETADRDGKALTHAGQAHLFICRDPETAQTIATHKTLKKLCTPCGDLQLVVPTKSLPSFKKQVRALGLGIV